VPDNCTVVGVPGRCVKQEGERVMSMTLRHDLLPDPVLQRLEELQREIETAEENILSLKAKKKQHKHEG
jgi:serine O-acetyltransferase